MTPNRIKKHRKREHGGGHMALVPFIDVMTILVVFLLVHTSDVEIVPNTKNITIPISVSEKKPHPSVVVMITKEDVLVDGQLIAHLSDITASDTLVIAPLREALHNQADKALVSAAQQSIAEREVTIMGDRDIPYVVLKKVMATCTDADYGKVSLAVIERDRPSAAGAKPAA
jgi:biopolymer transport protein TolR